MNKNEKVQPVVEPVQAEPVQAEPVQDAEPKKESKPRLHKLTADPKANVHGEHSMASYRFNKAIDAINTLGLCSGSLYDWSASAISVDELEAMVYTAVESAFANIRNGKKIVELAVKL